MTDDQKQALYDLLNEQGPRAVLHAVSDWCSGAADDSNFPERKVYNRLSAAIWNVARSDDAKAISKLIARAHLQHDYHGSN